MRIDEKSRVAETDEFVLVDFVPFLLKLAGNYYPALKSDISVFPNVYIDKGAISFIVKGADLMRPGIAEFDEFTKDSVVVIRDRDHKKALALGFALFSSDELKTTDKGKAVKTYTYVGDKYWK